MASTDNSIRLYQEIAGCYHQQGQAQVRDRFLVLAADAALSAGRSDEAESLRARLLKLNPHHLLKPFASLAQALQSPDVKNYVEGLQRTYPHAVAEELLQSMKGGAAPPPAPVPPPAPAPPPIDSGSPFAFSPSALPAGPGNLGTFGFAPETPAAFDNAAPRRERAQPSGFCTLLFILVLAAGLALLVYTFAKPFLGQG